MKISVGRQSHRDRRLAVRSIAAFVALTLALGACSSGTSSGGRSGSSIDIITIGDWTQPAGGTTNPEYPAGAQAAVARINSAGGINGRKINLIVCSDEANPNAARSCANEAVTKHVAAVVGLQSTVSSSILPILSQRNIPVIGIVPFTSADVAGANTFALTGGVITEFAGQMFALQAAGAKKVSFVAPAALAGIIANVMKAAATAAGVTFARTVEIPDNTSDLSSVIAAATSGGVDGVAGFAYDEAGFIQTFRSIAPNVRIATSTFNMTSQVIKSLGGTANGVLLAPDTVPYNLNTPGTTQFRDDMRAFNSKLPLSNIGLHEWLAVTTFAKVIKDLNHITSADVQGAFDKLRNLDMGGIVPPYSTVVGKGDFARLFSRTVYPVVIKSGVMEPLSSGQSFISSFAG